MGKKHILKAELSEHGTIYREKSIDIYSIILLSLIGIFGLLVLAIVVINFVLPLLYVGSIF